jgi:uncharacterized damage-inducible protein DinB
MIRSTRRWGTTLGLSLGLASAVGAQNVKAEMQAAVDDAATKIVALAEAIPAEKFAWRPGTGVRSVSEVLIHVASGNMGIPGLAGVTRKAERPLARDAEKTVTSKAAVIAALKDSYAYLALAAADIPDAQLNDPVNLFGQKSTKRGVLVLLATHNHEHLGQMIAYARMNGIAPPWSRGAN